MTERTTTCRVCGLTMPDDPGAYYHKVGCEQLVARAKWEAARDYHASLADLAIDNPLRRAAYARERQLYEAYIDAGNTGD